MSGYTAGKISALVVDEAHKLSPGVLEEIRLLGNFENSDDKLIQVVLIGQDELTDVLNREDLRQLKQRIAVRLKLERLCIADVAQYIEHRWAKAGGAMPTPFRRSEIEKIGAVSRGIPRLINAICDNALMVAFARGQLVVSGEDVQEAAQDLDLLRGLRRDVPAVLPAPPPTIELSPPPQNVVRFRTLERYGGTTDVKPSFWSRCAGKLGLA